MQRQHSRLGLWSGGNESSSFIQSVSSIHHSFVARQSCGGVNENRFVKGACDRQKYKSLLLLL